MKEELKTLRDMEENEKYNPYKGRNKVAFINSEKLKAEAVKELKIVDNLYKESQLAGALRLYDLCKTQEEIQNALFGVRRFLIWKFNLTSEDLK